MFKIKGTDGKVHEWLVDLKSPPGNVTKGTGKQTCSNYVGNPYHCVLVLIGMKGGCTLSMKDSDFMDLVTGKLGAQKVKRIVSASRIPFLSTHATFLQAFFEGKLKIGGNTSLALKLQTVMPKPGQAKL